jgi:Protein of unknown function (DUF3800)
MTRVIAPAAVRRYFVDEAGDATLFNGKGRVLLGEPGCSRFFMLGVLEVANPAALAAELAALRQRLLADPYFREVPSLQPERRKTAVAFHAKDDLPEVRREVFQVLMQHELQFHAVVRDKRRVLDYVQRRNQVDERYRYQPNDLYDTLVSRLFKNRLHLAPEVEICFASRGNSDRSAALRLALTTARARFESQWQREVTSQVDVIQRASASEPALQAADYFLWALQRHYERGESRFARLIWPKVGVVQAIDETELAPYGVYYTKKKPLVV